MISSFKPRRTPRLSRDFTSQKKVLYVKDFIDYGAEEEI